MIDRRRMIRLSAASVLAPALASRYAHAQVWPSRIVRFVVPYTAGGPTDLVARLIGERLTTTWGRQVIIENRGGAGGGVGNAAAARAEPDGYTLLMTLSSLAVLPEADRLFERKPAYEVAQLAPVARVLADPTLLAIPADAPWKTLKDFVEDAKKRPGEIP